MKTDSEALLLRAKGLRATPARVALLSALMRARGPLSADDLHAKVPSADLVTVYRALQNFTAAGLVREVRFKDATARYEFAHGAHHHHLVCTGCGMIDELPECDVAALEQEVLAKSKRFAAIEEHALEFFGTCAVCAKR